MALKDSTPTTTTAPAPHTGRAAPRWAARVRTWARDPHTRFAALLWLAAALTALLASAVLDGANTLSAIGDILGGAGLDADRIHMVDALLLALLGAACSAALFRRRLPAWAGGTLYYLAAFLVPYLAALGHPSTGPDGKAQQLLPGAAVNAVVTLLALGGLLTAAGAVLGQALGDVLARPVAGLIRWALAVTGNADTRATSPRASLGGLGLGILLMASLVIAFSGIGDLLYYGTTAELFAPARQPAVHGSVRQGTYRSPALGGLARTYWVYLPPSYATSPARRYPTLYLLHGSPGNPGNWFNGVHIASTADALISEGRMRETILIAPDGNGPRYPVSAWVNSWDGRQRMEDSVATDLVRFIDAHYRTLADAQNRAIAGLSEGGYGAVNIALHHPDVFRSVISLSGYFVEDGTTVYDYGHAAPAYLLANSPEYYAETPTGRNAAAALSFVIAVGTQDRGYYGDGLAFYHLLRQQHDRAQLVEVPGAHTWPVWALQMGQALPLIEPGSAPAPA